MPCHQKARSCSFVVTSEIDDEPVAEGGDESDVIDDDEDTGPAVKFAYHMAQNSITIGEGAEMLTVVQNPDPDHSYLVNGEHAQNGKEALALLKKSALYRDASPYLVLLAYGNAQFAPVFDQRSLCSPYQSQTASPPAVCTLFKDFCDCVACDKAGKTSCSLCP